MQFKWNNKKVVNAGYLRKKWGLSSSGDSPLAIPHLGNSPSRIKNMKNIILGMMLGALLQLVMPTFGAGDTFERLTVAGPNGMAPYAFVSKNGVYTGYSVDLMREIGETMSISNILFYPNSLQENLKHLANNEIDCIHFAPYTSQLARDFYFAAVYYNSIFVVFTKSNRYDIIDEKDLQGKKVAIIHSSPIFNKLKREGHSFILPAENMGDGFLMLANEKVDAFIGERVTGLHYLGKEKLDEQFKILDREVAHQQYGVLVNKDRNDLKQFFKQAFKAIEQTGKSEQILRRWFGEKVKSQDIYSRPIIRRVMIFIGATLLVSVIVLGWNLLLQRELEIKAIAIEKVNLDRKIAEEKIRFEAIVQSMTEGLMLVNPNGVIAYVNAPGSKYLGRRQEDLINHSLQELYDFLLPKIRKKEVLQKKFNYIEKHRNKPYTIEYTITQNKRLDIRLKYFPVRDRQAHYAGRGILIQDVTHERELDRLKSEFVSIASHELRTPMTSILGFSEIMLTKQLPLELIQRYTSQIHSEAERLTRILNDMLDLSYLESGESGLEKQPLNVLDLTREVVENFKAQLKDRREIRIEHKEETVVPLVADKDKLTQVLWNLLSNADKYSPHGKEVLISIEKYFSDATDTIIKVEGQPIFGEGILVSITDFGQGIPDEQLSMIFIPFYRVETAVHTIRGTGLGLAIVKRIVEAHGGKVWVNSIVGKTTTFTFYLPYAMSEPVKDDERV